MDRISRKSLIEERSQVKECKEIRQRVYKRDKRETFLVLRSIRKLKERNRKNSKG